MQFWSVHWLRQSRYPLAVGAGLLLAIAFPGIGIAGFAWIAPGLMLVAALGKRGVESFRIGYVAGLAHYLASLHWLLFIPVTGFPILGWVALAAYLALYPAVWVWLCTSVLGPKSKVQSPANLRSSIAAVAEAGWSRRTSWALSCAAIWVALEMIVARFLGGFPWNLLGVSQHRILPLIQIASLTGVNGVSFLVVWTSVSLLSAAAVIVQRPNPGSVWLREIMLPFIAIVAAFAFGFHQLKREPPVSRELKVAMVQPSIPQTLIWNPEKGAERFRELIRLSDLALAHPTDLLIWPEAAIPKLLRYDPETFQAVTNLAVQHHVWMIVGSDDAEPPRHSNDPKEADYFNSSFLISPDGKLVAGYKKRNLVIFGEYIPFEHWLPFVKWFTPIQGSFTPGDRAVPFELTGEGDRLHESYPLAKTSVLICFEDMFSPLAREGAEPDTDFLVNITNDGWFGESAAQWQQAAAAGFRAIENGLPLIRCTNTGLTCWFDACGRVMELFTDDNGSVYGAGFLTVKIPLLQPGEKRVPTFYHLYGDGFGWTCVVIAAVVLGRAMIRNRQWVAG